MLLSCIQPTGIWAAEWAVSPSLGIKGVYNSNLLFTHLPHGETYGYWVSPAAEFAGNTERLELSGKVAMDFVSYYGGQESQFTNIFLPLTLRYKTETDIFEFTGGFTRDSTLAGELLTTGVLLRFTQRNQWLSNPSWTRSLTEKLSFQSSFQFSDAAYEKGLQLGLVDYQLFGGSGGLFYQITEQDKLQLSGMYMNFHTTNAPFALRAAFPGIILGLTHSFTETLTGSLNGGPRFMSSTTQSAGDNLKTRQTVWTFGGNITKTFERASVQASISRDILPSGFGLLVQTDRVGILASHDLSEHLAVSLDTSSFLVTGATTLARGGALPEFRFVVLTPKISWRLFEWWKVDLSYTYGTLKTGGIPELATSNAVSLMVTYNPPKLSFSN